MQHLEAELRISSCRRQRSNSRSQDAHMAQGPGVHPMQRRTAKRGKHRHMWGRELDPGPGSTDPSGARTSTVRTGSEACFIGEASWTGSCLVVYPTQEVTQRIPGSQRLAEGSRARTVCVLCRKQRTSVIRLGLLADINSQPSLRTTASQTRLGLIATPSPLTAAKKHGSRWARPPTQESRAKEGCCMKLYRVSAVRGRVVSGWGRGRACIARLRVASHHCPACLPACLTVFDAEKGQGMDESWGLVRVSTPPKPKGLGEGTRGTLWSRLGKIASWL